MDPSVEPLRPHIAAICRSLGVRRLDLLGPVPRDGDGEARMRVDLGTSRDDARDVHAALVRHIEGMLGVRVDLAVAGPGTDPPSDEPLYEA